MITAEHRYWDSSVFLAYIKGETGRVDVCEEIIKMARNGDIQIVSSTVALAEVVRPGRKGTVELTEDADKKIVAFFRSPFISLVEFSIDLGADSRKLQWEHNLHVRDAIHVATALSMKVSVIESYDPDFLKSNVSATVPECPPIREPKGRDRPLFDKVIMVADAQGTSPAPAMQPNVSSGPSSVSSSSSAPPPQLAQSPPDEKK